MNGTTKPSRASASDTAKPEERVGPGQAGGFRLAGGRGDVRGPDDADTDTGADRGEAVPEGADVAGDFGELFVAASVLTWGCFSLSRDRKHPILG